MNYSIELILVGKDRHATYKYINSTATKNNENMQNSVTWINQRSQ